jgi:glycosyltransferase involved in cell wall biosynthesis
MSHKTSVVIPVYNEEATLREIVERVLAAPFDKEIIAVNDGSTDRSADILRELAAEHPDCVKIVLLPVNRGKGTALRAGFARASGDVIVVQDADLEYDPRDIPKLLKALERPSTDIVYGARRRTPGEGGHVMYLLGGALVSLAASLLFRTHFIDVMTCYKVFPRKLLDRIKLTCTRFDYCPEITAKALMKSFAIREAPISYRPRTFEQGKKIGWRDGIECILCLLRYRLAR